MDKNILIKLFDLFEINKKYANMVCEAKANPEAFLNKYDELRDTFIYPSNKLYIGVIEEILEQNEKALTLDWKADAFDIMKGLEYLDIIDREDILAMELPSAIDKPMDGAFVCIIDYLKKYTDLSLADGKKDPFVLLRIGECHYEMGNFEEAKKYLLETHKYDVKNLMEMEDSKYFNLIKDLI